MPHAQSIWHSWAFSPAAGGIRATDSVRTLAVASKSLARFRLAASCSAVLGRLLPATATVRLAGASSNKTHSLVTAPSRRPVTYKEGAGWNAC